MADANLSQPRSVWEIFATALRTYRRFPVLFLGLSVILEVPIQVLLAILGDEKAGISTSAALIALVVQYVLLIPAMAVLQVQAIQVLADGERPSFGTVLRMALPVLPAAVAAEIIAGIGIAVGLFLLILPGVIVYLRWAVVAQTAAVEHTDWPTTIRRSTQLTRGNSWRVLGVVLIGALLDEILVQAANAGNGVGQAIIAIVLSVLISPLVTLMTSYLYFDLRARENLRDRRNPA